MFAPVAPAHDGYAAMFEAWYPRTILRYHRRMFLAERKTKLERMTVPVSIPAPPVRVASLHQSPSRRGTGRAARARYFGVDIARFLAIVGMMATHLLAENAMNPGAAPFEQGAGQVALTLTTGIAAPLFAVLGGLSLVFAARRPLKEGRIGAAMGAVAIRGGILILLGLLLGLIDSPLVIVLAYYGIAMLLLAPLIAAPSWLLTSLAVVLGVGGGAMNALVRGALGVVNEGGSVTFDAITADPLGSLQALLLTGPYPAITWCMYLLAGMLLARILVTATNNGVLKRASLTLAGVGAAAVVLAQLVSAWALANLAVLGFKPIPGVDTDFFAWMLTQPSFGAPTSPELWAQLIATPHTGSPMDLLKTLGIACAVIGILVFLCDARGRDSLARPIRVIRAAGAAPLTIYTLHAIATGLLLGLAMADPSVAESGLPWWAFGTAAFGLQLAGVLLVGAILEATGRRGPLEALLSVAVRFTNRNPGS